MANLKLQQIELQKTATAGTEKSGLGSRLLGLLNVIKNGAISGFTSAFGFLERNVDGASSKLAQFGAQAMQTDINSRSLARSLFSLGNIFTAMVKRQFISSIFQNVTSGLQALEKSSLSAGAGLRGIASAGTYAGNSVAAAIAPLAGMILPVFNAITNAIVTAMNALARFFALLSGKSTYTKAVKQNTAVAGAAGGVAKKAKEAAQAVKEEEKALASFDEINQLNLKDQQELVTPDIDDATGGGGGGGGGGLAFTEEQIRPTEFMLELAERLKAIWADLVAIAQTLGEKWREAWEYNGNGAAILETLKQILWDILDMIKGITEATLEWAKNLSFIPLVEAIRNVVESLEPVVQRICDAILWVWVNAVLPMSKWFIEGTLPAILNVIAGILDVIVALCDALSPVLQEIWDNIIAPFAAEIGQYIIDVLTGLAELLADLAVWITQHTELCQGVLKVILLIVTAIGLAAVGFTLLATPISAVATLIVLLSSYLLANKQRWSEWGQAIEGTINSVVDKIRGGLNNAISSVEGFINRCIDALNGFLSGASAVASFMGFGGFGSIGHISLPRLATGTVVPPGAGEFAAILGDNNTDTEVVSPLETIKDALVEALAETGGIERPIVIKFDGTMGELVRMLKPELDSEDRRVGVRLVTE